MPTDTKRKLGRPRIHEGGGVKRLVYLPSTLEEWLKVESKRTGLPISQIVSTAIAQLKARS